AANDGTRGDPWSDGFIAVHECPSVGGRLVSGWGDGAPQAQCRDRFRRAGRGAACLRPTGERGGGLGHRLGSPAAMRVRAGDAPFWPFRRAAIAAGEFHSLALKRDGTVVAWGDDRYGQADVPSGLSGVTAI